MPPPPSILPTAYFGTIQYFTKIIAYPKIIIECYDHYARQTFRNRCVILGANGKIVLSIPVKKVQGSKTLVRDIRIDYATPWQKIHRQSIISAYSNAPFFEYYFDEHEWVYSRRTDFLIDLNTRITETLIAQMNLGTELKLSIDFQPVDSETDFRNILSPKSRPASDPHFFPVQYTQVFSDKFDFVSNLSILDLLFNTGPETSSILERSCRHQDFEK